MRSGSALSPFSLASLMPASSSDLAPIATGPMALSGHTVQHLAQPVQRVGSNTGSTVRTAP